MSTSSGSSGYVEKYDQDGNSVWSMKTPLFPLGGAVSPNDFLIANGPGEFYLAGSIRASQGDAGLVQAFSASPSLVFFGVNPPLSFVLFGSLTGVAVLSVFLFWRRRVRVTSNRPKSTSPDRYRKPGDTLSNSNSFFPM